MCRNNVIKKLAGLALIGAAIGAALVFFKKFEQEDDDLFDDLEEADEDCDMTCPGCSSGGRTYTTIPLDSTETAAQDAVKEAIKRSEEEVFTEAPSEDA